MSFQGSNSIVGYLFCYLIISSILVTSMRLKDKHKCLILYSAFKRITVKIEKGFGVAYTYIYIYISCASPNAHRYCVP